MEERDPYQVLRLNSNQVTMEEVKSAYKRLALLYHPDKCDGDDRLFKEIKHAYQTILSQLKGKSNTYSYDKLKDNYRQFVMQQGGEPVEEPKEGVGEEDPKKQPSFDLEKFNAEFVEKQKNKADIPLVVSEVELKERQKQFFQNKITIENELGSMNRVFDKGPFDRNVFNRFFDHVNGTIDIRSQEIAKYEGITEPLPLSSTYLDKFSSDLNAETSKKGNSPKKEYVAPTTFGQLKQSDKMSKNPGKISQQLAEVFSKQKDVTINEPVDNDFQQKISQRIKEYRNKKFSNGGGAKKKE